jgi:hypothetical protein
VMNFKRIELSKFLTTHKKQSSKSLVCGSLIWTLVCLILSELTVYSRLPDIALKMSGLMTAVEGVGPVDVSNAVRSDFNGIRREALSWAMIAVKLYTERESKGC